MYIWVREWIENCEERNGLTVDVGETLVLTTIF